jgi:hypothetical protein
MKKKVAELVFLGYEWERKWYWKDYKKVASLIAFRFSFGVKTEISQPAERM